MDTRIAALRRAEQVHQRTDAGGARFESSFPPALVEEVFDLEEFGDIGGRRSLGAHASEARRAPIRAVSSRAICWRLRILSTTSPGALARNA